MILLTLGCSLVVFFREKDMIGKGLGMILVVLQIILYFALLIGDKKHQNIGSNNDKKE